MWLAVWRIAGANRRELASLKKQFEASRARYETIIERLCGAVGMRDSLTDEESQRLSRLASVLVRQMRVPTEQVKLVEQAAALRDVGKQGVAQSVLLKEDDFTEQDWAEMKRHPEIGYEILREISFLADVADVVRCHHERFDGQGYPRGVAGDSIPLAARILAVLGRVCGDDVAKAVPQDALSRRCDTGSPAQRGHAVRPGNRPSLHGGGQTWVVRERAHGRASSSKPPWLRRLSDGHRNHLRLPKRRIPSRKHRRQRYSRRARPDVPVEVIMDSYRVNGELFAPGVPRRLVDILNSNDLSYFTMRSGTLDDPFDPEAEPRSFDLIQLDKNGILLAIPRGEVHKPDPFEVVRKKRLESTVVVPGYRVSGELYLMPDADPTLVPIISDHHFIPLTDVTVVADKGQPKVWEEQLLIVNMTRALFFGTKKPG